MPGVALPHGKKATNAIWSKITATDDLKTNLHVALVLFGCARGVERNVGHCIARLHHSVLEQILLDFFAADIGQHFVVNLDAGRKWLATFCLHFPAKSRIRDDVLFGIGQTVLVKHSTNASAPAAIRFEVGGDLRFFHDTNLPSSRAKASPERSRMGSRAPVALP